MENTSENRQKKQAFKPSNHINIGLLAHVDAGKTTLAESILYLTGAIRKLGRVDHKDAFLDTDELERARGITIFSKQAEFSLGETQYTLLDTPGHVDFSAEMERTLQVLDYAVLIISGADGVQGHVETLWRLLTQYKIPVFLFINKMDQPGTDRSARMEELHRRLDDRCMDFGEQGTDEFYENVAMCSEDALESYLEHGSLSVDEISSLILERKVFPCFFGSALKLNGVEEFLESLYKFTRCPEYPEEFGARVFKISRDEQGNRLTWMKITGGSLKVKTVLHGQGEDGWEEKADQLRVYSGTGYQMVQEAPAGSVVAVTGLTKTKTGEGLGREWLIHAPLLEPVLNYQIQLPEGCDVYRMFLKLRELEEEIPELHIVWEKQSNEIHAQVMGEVQIEILKSMIQKRFDVAVEFGSGSIVYKETIASVTEGVGHFEPLRHYAEVHLLMEPLEPGSGLVFDTVCSEDDLDRNWQRLILTHLEERKHPGVLTGSEITDMKITLAAGRAHLKHTEGGDFRQATYRAVRQGLKKAECILLEPVYEFRLELPNDLIGRGMTDIQKMHGTFQPPETEGELSILTGSVPAATMRDYQKEVTAYSRGRGRLVCSLKGYEPCHNTEEVIAAIGYDSEKDTENPTGSVFCAHGAGFNVPWDQVENYMHLESCLRPEQKQQLKAQQAVMGERSAAASSVSGGGSLAMDKELQEIFERTYGRTKRERQSFGYATAPKTEYHRPRPEKKPQKEYLLVDGYNIIFSWEELKELAKINIESARNKLMDILSNYQGYKKNTLILVFDAYKVAGNPGEQTKYHNIHVVYTKEAETADQYIEKTVHEIGRQYHVTVATSDATEQIIVLSQGAARMSARELQEEIQQVNQEIRETWLERHPKSKDYLLDHIPEDMADFMEEVRLGKKQFDEKNRTV